MFQMCRCSQYVTSSVPLWHIDYFELEVGLQNHCWWWVQPWNEKTFAPWKKSYDKLLSLWKTVVSFWALIDMKQLTIDHTVILRPQVTIIQWVQSSPKTHRIGQAQESSIIKWKWYIQDQAKPGPHGFMALHKRISKSLTKGLNQQALIKPKITE